MKEGTLEALGTLRATLDAPRTLDALEKPTYPERRER
jgi:hypothetical protein